MGCRKVNLNLELAQAFACFSNSRPLESAIIFMEASCPEADCIYDQQRERVKVKDPKTGKTLAKFPQVKPVRRRRRKKLKK